MKTKILPAVAGLALGLFLLIPLTVSAQVGGGVSVGPGGVSGGVGGNVGGVNFSIGFGNGGGAPWLMNPFGLPQGSILGIIGALTYWLLAAFGFLGMIGFIISGILYLTAAGDDNQMDKAKNAMKWSIMGIIVGIMGFVIIQAVTYWLNESSFF